MLVAIDGGRTAVKRVGRAPGGRVTPLVDDARGALRSAPAAGGTADERARDLVTRARGAAAELGGLAVLAHDEVDARALGDALSRAAPGLRTLALPTAVAAVLAEPGPPAADGEVDAVLDLGQGALRLGLVRWFRVGADAFPRLEVTHDVGPGGEDLDRRLAAVARGRTDGVAFHELKELLPGRGPWVRAWPEGEARVEARAGADALRGWLGALEEALPALAGRVRAAGPRRALVVGGLAHLAPARDALLRALAPLPVTLARDPLFAAGRGALDALERPPTPRAAAPLAVVARGPGGVSALTVVPAGSALPGRFGPLRLRARGPGEHVVTVVEGEGEAARALEARLRAPAEPVDAWLAWDFGAGWSVEVGGARAPLAPAAPAAAQAAREALRFPWASHGQAVPLDLVVVFRATQGGGEATARAVGEAVGKLGAAAAAQNQDVRLRAIAVGDHPQGHLRPAFVTLAQPAWTARPDELARWTAERLAQPVDGIDAAEAYECALKEAGQLDWRADAERLLVLLADAPVHAPDQPPYCPVDWRAEAARLREQRVTVVPVHVAVVGSPPVLRRQVLAFLEGLGAPIPLRSGTPGPELLAAIASAAGARRLDAAARRVMDGVAFERA